MFVLIQPVQQMILNGGFLSAVTMTNSSGQLNNVNASLSIPANRHHSFAVMNITNSTTEINGGTYSITNPNNADANGYYLS